MGFPPESIGLELCVGVAMLKVPLAVTVQCHLDDRVGTALGMGGGISAAKARL